MPAYLDALFKQKWLGLIVISVVPFIVQSCSVARCATLAPKGEPLVEVFYVYGGDAPTVTMVRLFPAGFVEVEPLGSRRRCKKVARSDWEDISDLIVSPEFSEVLRRGGSKNVGMDHDFITVRSSGLQISGQYSDLPQPARDVLEMLHSQLKTIFPRITTAYFPRLGPSL